MHKGWQFEPKLWSGVADGELVLTDQIFEDAIAIAVSSGGEPFALFFDRKKVGKPTYTIRPRSGTVVSYGRDWTIVPHLADTIATTPRRFEEIPGALQITPTRVAMWFASKSHFMEYMLFDLSENSAVNGAIQQPSLYISKWSLWVPECSGGGGLEMKELLSFTANLRD